MGFLFGFSWQQYGWCQIHGPKNGQLRDVVYFKIIRVAAHSSVRSDGISCSLLEGRFLVVRKTKTILLTTAFSRTNNQQLIRSPVAIAEEKGSSWFLKNGYPTTAFQRTNN
jgi:hypothetical protein